MKHITIFIYILFIVNKGLSQVNIEAGFNSRLGGVGSVGYEKQTNWNNTQLNATFSTDNIHPIIGLQTGFGTDNGFQMDNIRFLAGVFYHQGMMQAKTDERISTIKFGGSVRYELNNGTCNLTWNGETISFTLGYLFKR